MEHIVTLITEFGALIFGAGGIIASFLFYTQTRRLKKSEATHSEIANLLSLIESLKSEIKRLEEKQQALERRLNEKDNLVSELYRKIEDIERKYSVKKRSINCAFECKKNNNDCPVLLKLAELEQ